nr:hypothetical protein CFP56_64772 [Quercus suber]
MPIIPIYFQQENDMSPRNRPHEEASSSSSSSSSASTVPVVRKHKFPLPTLRLQLNDLSHEGASVFLSNVKGNEDISTQVQNVLNLLYTADSIRPGTRSVTFVVREFPGVAYTTGIELDDDHKEIHVNAQYVASRTGNVRDEVLGVICHELVHCFQWNSRGTAPGGLIEGIADWVRLRAGLGAAHWKQEADGAWDQGYQHTGFFLEWLEQKFGPGTVRRINDGLREGQYDEGRLFADCCDGGKVEKLWKEYRAELEKDEVKPSGTAEAGRTVPTDTPPRF